MNNTYGIKAYNDTVYNYAKFACYMANGCLDQVKLHLYYFNRRDAMLMIIRSDTAD